MKRKGFTLTELVVVMAVSVIFLGIVVALLISADWHYQVRAVNQQTRDELTLVENTVENFLSAYDTDEYSIETDGETPYALHITGKNDHTVYYDEENCVLNLDGETHGFSENIVSVAFELYDDDSRLVKCSVTYTDAVSHSKKTEKVFTFLHLKHSRNP